MSGYPSIPPEYRSNQGYYGPYPPQPQQPSPFTEKFINVKTEPEGPPPAMVQPGYYSSGYPAPYGTQGYYPAPQTSVYNPYGYQPFPQTDEFNNANTKQIRQGGSVGPVTGGAFHQTNMNLPRSGPGSEEFSSSSCRMCGTKRPGGQFDNSSCHQCGHREKYDKP